jgi:hypothetical protein
MDHIFKENIDFIIYIYYSTTMLVDIHYNQPCCFSCRKQTDGVTGLAGR